MQLPRFNVLVSVCLIITAVLFAAGCSDDDKSTAPTGQWCWAPLGSGIDGWGDILELAVYDNELIAGGMFSSTESRPIRYLSK